MLSYFQAVVLGLLQGVTELFPVSSLGHTVLLPALLGWNNLVTAQSASESFYLAFVGLAGLLGSSMYALGEGGEPVPARRGSVVRTLERRMAESSDAGKE